VIELIDTHPEVNVQPAEYFRLLGYPRGREPEGRAEEAAVRAREWYAEHGRPWIYAREAELLEIADRTISIDGELFVTPRLQHSLECADAHSVIVAAVCAGPEAEQETQRLWRKDKPDEYFFLEMFAAAVVEHLVASVGTRLWSWAEERGMAVLPHYSPGYSEWDIGEQPRLLALVKRRPLPGELHSLDSGALLPKKSLLAVFGLTRHSERVQRISDIQPCETCSLTPCRYRRAPYREQREARYTVNPKALRRWAAERLRIEPLADGKLLAKFRYDGTTCSNMGLPLAFDYTVLLGSREQGYPIVGQSCSAAPGDTGHRSMCQYVKRGEDLMAEVAGEKPLAGQPLADVLGWTRTMNLSGCYCDAAGRDHKWGLVLETIHFKLNENA
jgi:hypothetical protein